MQLTRLSLFNFRNYVETRIDFSDGIHVIYGENGAGKTSILEAIHYLALTKSFRTSVDKHLILHQEGMFRIQGQFQTSQGQSLNTSIAYSMDKGKHLTVNRQKAQKFSEYIGEVPVVLLNPADLNLSQGSPAQRRRFMDVLLSQSSKLYLHHLIQYNRSLKQRNRLLDSELKDWQLIHSWEENLVTHGTEVILKRKETAEQLSEMVSRFYQELSQEVDRVKIIYRSNVPFRTGEDVVEVYRQQFEQKRAQETNYGATMVGPHRDDLLFLINGTIMKDYASQGEHKTFVIALKLAEFRYLQQQRSQSPILLFDDIFGELDSQRIQSMLNQLSQIGQVFVTTTSRNFFDKVRDFDASTHYYFVEEGKIEAIEA